MEAFIFNYSSFDKRIKDAVRLSQEYVQFTERVRWVVTELISIFYIN